MIMSRENKRVLNINSLVYYTPSNLVLGKNNLQIFVMFLFIRVSKSSFHIALVKSLSVYDQNGLHVTKLECSFVGAFVTRAALADNQKNCLHGLNIMQSKYSYTFLGRCNARTLVFWLRYKPKELGCLSV